MTDWKTLSALDRFILQTDAHDEGCWLWVAHCTRQGYGMIAINGKQIPAHRAAYLLLVGPIPDGCDLHHVCENPRCVNPAHLSPVTPRTHVNISVNHYALKTHCKKGHEFTPENTYTPPSQKRRFCRECARVNSAGQSQRRKKASGSSPL